MTRRSADSESTSHPVAQVCGTCRLVRRFLLAVGFLAVVYLTSPQWHLPEGVDYGTLVGDAFLVTFFLVLAYRFRQFRRRTQADANSLTWMGTSRPVPPRRRES